MIKVKNLTKIYSGNKKALNNINLEIKKGEFTAILGENGAGKSTLINILAGHVIKTSGKAYIRDIDIDEAMLDTKKIIGVVPQEINIDSFFTVNDILLNQSGYFGIKNNQKYIDELLKILSLEDKKNVNSKKLSGGMRRRLLIAKALIHKPDILILDEPTAGVDINLRHSLYEFLKKLHKNGTTIILTTHYLEEAEHLCDRTVILNEGNIIADEDTKKLIQKLGDVTELNIECKKDLTDKQYIFKDYKYSINKNIIKIKVPQNKMYAVLKIFDDNKIEYVNMNIKEPRLEDVFIKLISNKK